MARMNDYEYALMEENRDRAITARSARHTRTHCGKGGAVRFPSDNLTKKELKAMSGECIKYASLKKPMTWKEFKYLPEDLQKEYIRWIRGKFGAPDSHIANMFNIAKGTLSGHLQKLNLNQGDSGHGNGKKLWRKDEFRAWLNGVDLNTNVEPVEDTQEPVSNVVNIITVDQMNALSRVDAENPDSCSLSDIRDLVKRGVGCIAEPPKPAIPRNGSMTFDNACVNDIAAILESVLQGTMVNCTVSWIVAREKTKED